MLRQPSYNTIYITAVKVRSRVRCLTSRAINTGQQTTEYLLDVKYSLLPKLMTPQQPDCQTSQARLA